MWVGDQYLIFRKVALVDSSYTRNEWLYIGRRTSGSLLCSFQLLGVDASLFHLNTDAATVPAFDAFRLKVTLAYNATVQLPESVDAFILIKPEVGDPAKALLLVQMESTVGSLLRDGHPIAVETENASSARRHSSFLPHITVSFLGTLGILACAWRRKKVTYTLLLQDPVCDSFDGRSGPC
jgi:hypothetical protein